jgi:hypothetical protein
MSIDQDDNVRGPTPHIRDRWVNYRFIPQHLAADESGLWVAESSLPLLAHVDQHGNVVGPTPLEVPDATRGDVHGLGLDRDGVWVRFTTGLTHFNPRSGQQREVLIPGAHLAVGDEAIWTLGVDGHLVRVDLQTATPEAFAPVGVASALLAAHGLVWVMVWDPPRTIVVRIDPRTGNVVGSTVTDGAAQTLLGTPHGVVARVWRRVGASRRIDDTLVSLDRQGIVLGERIITPTGVDATLHGDEVWVSARDPFDDGLLGLPSAVRKVRADGTEELIPVPGSVDRLTSGSRGIWARLHTRNDSSWFGSVIEVSEGGRTKAHGMSTIDVTEYLPPPPAAIEAKPVEESVRDRLAESLLLGGVAVDPDTGAHLPRPYIEGVTFEDVRLEKSFPDTEVVALFRAEEHPGLLFGRRRRVWEASGELSGSIDVMDVNLMEDVMACGYGLPRNPEADGSGICWF